MTLPGWLEPSDYYRQLPAVHVAALALLRDEAGRVLLIKQSYRSHWDLPGGMAEDGEPPDKTVAREIREELGLDTPPRHLAAVDWAPPMGERQRPVLAFVFAADVVPAEPAVALQHVEIDAWRMASIAEVSELVPDLQAARVRAAVAAADAGVTAYLVQGVAVAGMTIC